jgi:hypothetical protein
VKDGRKKKRGEIIPFKYKMTDEPITGMAVLIVFMGVARVLGMRELPVPGETEFMVKRYRDGMPI